MATVLRRPRAEDDLIEIWTYIARDNPVAADSVLDAVETTIGMLLEMPEAGVRYASRIRRLAGLRFFPVRGFHAYLIYYRPIEDGIEIVRVLRGERDRDTMLMTES